MAAPFDLIFLSAGQGTRVGLQEPKQFLDLCGKPVLVHSLEIYNSLPAIGRKIIVHDRSEASRTKQILERSRITNYLLVEGGGTRQESVCNGLAHAQTPRILTHNAAVPLISSGMIQAVLSNDADCVTTATEVHDNMVREVSGRLDPVPRKGLKIINSPQSFDRDLFLNAHQKAREEGLRFNSDSELMLHYGHSVCLVPGPRWSFKITDRVDLALAATILSRPELFPDFHHA